MRKLVSLLWSEWKDLEQQIVGMNQEIEQIASPDPACQRLRQIPGIGPLVATAIVAANRQRRSLPQGPRVLLLAGACAAAALDWREGEAIRHQQAREQIPAQAPCARRPILLSGVKRDRSPFGPWLDTLETRAPINVVVTAAANKLARIAWAVLSSGQDYRAAVNSVAA